ncbi:MAG TPA: GTPase domain-containing protein [Polyangiaceae bacterium]|nr:GTPase domain-containing protein [Polyangiaceae bacterium]
MASINRQKRELVFKIVFYGPGLGGKTTTLKHVHGATKPEHRGNLLSLATDTDRTLYFDYLPVKLLKFGNMGVKLQLYTVPGQVYYAATRKLVLSGADGIVFVADTQAARFDSNHESLDDLIANLAEQGRKLSSVPHAFQWNKRDLPALVSLEESDRRLNLFGAPAVPTIATTGEGVFETLERITRLVVDAYRADLPVSPRAEGFPLFLDAEELGLTDAIKGLADSQPARSSPSDEHAAGAIAKPSPAMDETLPSNSSASGRGAAPAAAGERAGPAPAIDRVAPAGNQSTFSLAELWPPADREVVRRAELALASGNAGTAVATCGELFERVLASTSTLLGGEGRLRDPAVLVALLGLEGRRYLTFAAMVRGSRSRSPTAREALESYAFVVEARRALEHARGSP